VKPPTDVVLMVDDAPQSVGPLASELEAEGYTVLLASDGPSALERLRWITPDAILLDAVMPGLDGFETCRRVKTEPAWAHVPVIFMTGLAETEHVVAGFAAGGVDYVIKPLRAPEVLARLSAHVRNARTARLVREAVDVGGQGVVMVDGRGRLAWCSPHARLSMAKAFGPDPATAERALLQWLAASTAAVTGNPASRLTPCGAALQAQALGSAGLGETMWLLSLHAADTSAPAPSRVTSAALTPREAEVLSWVAKGKTNRDIGDILGMSPRTVNKHLEHIFEKLGVETRAAAAALASRETKP
jgi:DNA-binding response OmpR family regulator/DNA-binding CsgD family transcriptional regulator